MGPDPGPGPVAIAAYVLSPLRLTTPRPKQGNSECRRFVHELAVRVCGLLACDRADLWHSEFMYRIKIHTVVHDAQRNLTQWRAWLDNPQGTSCQTWVETSPVPTHCTRGTSANRRLPCGVGHCWRPGAAGAFCHPFSCLK